MLLELADRALLRSSHLAGATSRFIDTSEGRTHLLEHPGSGKLPPVVVLHGFTSWGAHYHGVIRRLRREVRQVVAPDMLGHGFSAQPVRLDASRMQAALFETLDAALDEPAVLFGNSLGGAAAIRYAAERPERVRALVLLSPGGAAMTDDELRELRGVFRVESYREALTFVDRLFTYRHPLRHILAAGVLQNFRIPRFQKLLESFHPGDLLSPADLSSLEMPVCCIWGGSETILPASGAAFFREHLPSHAQLIEPPRFGHAAFLDHPNAVARHIIDAARRCDKTKAKTRTPSSPA